jgi:hypothetical protein
MFPRRFKEAPTAERQRRQRRVAALLFLISFSENQQIEVPSIRVSAGLRPQKELSLIAVDYMCVSIITKPK